MTGRRRSGGLRRPRQEVREEILAVGSQLFAEHGVRATTMDMLAQAFGVTKQALYYYVNSKEQMLIDLTERAFDELLRAMDESAALADDPVARVRFLIRRHVEISTLPQYACLIAVEPSDYPDNDLYQKCMRDRAAEEHRGWSAVVADGMARGVFRHDLDPQIAALGIIGMCSWTSRWFTPGGRLSAAEVADHFSGLVLRSIVAASS